MCPLVAQHADPKSYLKPDFDLNRSRDPRTFDSMSRQPDTTFKIQR